MNKAQDLENMGHLREYSICGKGFNKPLKVHEFHTKEFLSYTTEDSPGEGNGNPFQYSCLENSMDRRAWRATVQAKSLTGLSTMTHDVAP